MSERPIMYRPDMLQAVNDDRKTQTRRLLKCQPTRTFADGEALSDALPAMAIGTCVMYHSWPHKVIDAGRKQGHRIAALRCPYGSPGDVLYVPETLTVATSEHSDGDWGLWYPDGERVRLSRDLSRFEKAGDYANPPEFWTERWHEKEKYKISAIYLRYHPEFARYFHDLTDVRVERVKDISQEDAQAEGVGEWHACTPELEQFNHPGNYRNSFHALWDSINAKRGQRLTETFWVPKEDLPAGDYEFSWDGGDWQKHHYWPDWYDKPTDTWVTPCIGDDPEAWMLDVYNPGQTKIRLADGRICGVRSVNKPLKRRAIGYGWDPNPFVWAITFKRKITS